MAAWLLCACWEDHEQYAWNPIRIHACNSKINRAQIPASEAWLPDCMHAAWMSAIHACPCLSCCVMLCCAVGQMRWVNKLGRDSQCGETQAMQQQRRHQLQHQQYYTTSLTRTPTCPNPALLIQACHTASRNIATLSTVGRYRRLTRSLRNNLLCLLAHTHHTHTQCILAQKRMNGFALESKDNHSSRMSISWLSGPIAEWEQGGAAGQIVNHCQKWGAYE